MYVVQVHVFRTEGDTDEQAEALKTLFADAAFMAAHRVISINSINWARIMVQSAYYFWGYLQLRPAVDGEVHFVVPTGAFGNATGGLVAKQMGLPIGRIVCATTSNDVVHRTISAGDLSIAPNVQTVSPAMDIQVSAYLRGMHACVVQLPRHMPRTTDLATPCRMLVLIPSRTLTRPSLHARTPTAAPDRALARALSLRTMSSG